MPERILTGLMTNMSPSTSSRQFSEISVPIQPQPTEAEFRAISTLALQEMSKSTATTFDKRSSLMTKFDNMGHHALFGEGGVLQAIRQSEEFGTPEQRMIIANEYRTLALKHADQGINYGIIKMCMERQHPEIHTKLSQIAERNSQQSLKISHAILPSSQLSRLKTVTGSVTKSVRGVARRAKESIEDKRLDALYTIHEFASHSNRRLKRNGRKFRRFIDDTSIDARELVTNTGVLLNRFTSKATNINWTPNLLGSAKKSIINEARKMPGAIGKLGKVPKAIGAKTAPLVSKIGRGGKGAYSVIGLKLRGVGTGISSRQEQLKTFVDSKKYRDLNNKEKLIAGGAGVLLLGAIAVGGYIDLKSGGNVVQTVGNVTPKNSARHNESFNLDNIFKLFRFHGVNSDRIFDKLYNGIKAHHTVHHTKEVAPATPITPIHKALGHTASLRFYGDTITNEVRDNLQRLGIEPKESRILKLTGHILRAQHLTWHAARFLPVHYKFNIPSPHLIKEILKT